MKHQGMIQIAVKSLVMTRAMVPAFEMEVTTAVGLRHGQILLDQVSTYCNVLKACLLYLQVVAWINIMCDSCSLMP